MSSRESSRPQVPDVARELREYRKLPDRMTGGPYLHIIVDDPNYEQHWADGAVEAAQGAVERGDDHADRDLALTTMIAALTDTQRRKLGDINTYPDLTTDCDRCDATGYVQGREKQVWCPKCNGRGFTDERPPVPWMPLPDARGMRQCKACEGGLTAADDWCLVCGGKGYVPLEDRNASR